MYIQNSMTVETPIAKNARDLVWFAILLAPVCAQHYAFCLDVWHFFGGFICKWFDRLHMQDCTGWYCFVCRLVAVVSRLFRMQTSASVIVLYANKHLNMYSMIWICTAWFEYVQLCCYYWLECQWKQCTDWMVFWYYYPIDHLAHRLAKIQNCC